jgi:hypothetical protein
LGLLVFGLGLGGKVKVEVKVEVEVEIEVEVDVKQRLLEEGGRAGKATPVTPSTIMLTFDFFPPPSIPPAGRFVPVVCPAGCCT